MSSTHRKIILENIDNLSNLTNFSKEFLKKWLSLDIITQDEVKMIKNQDTLYESNRVFYTCISTKSSKAFEALVPIMAEESAGNGKPEPEPEVLKILSTALENKRKKVTKGVKFHDGSDEIIPIEINHGDDE